MRLVALTPTQSLQKAYRLQAGNREQIDRFRASYTRLLSLINERESEENVKGHLMDFLKKTYYDDAYLVAPKGRTDFVIHSGKEATTPAGVLVEVKRPANKGEMITRQNLNAKAFHELLLYYFRERIDAQNNDIRYCVITNVYEWFIFDAADIDRLFFRNAHLTKEYKAWASKQKVSTNNDLFYNEIAKPFLAALADELSFTYFDLRAFQTTVSDADAAGDRDAGLKALLPLYKILSPTHLLKLPAATDSNRLNPKFYAELLHLIGLEEVKDAGKKIIRRKQADNGSTNRRDEGSLLENALIELDSSGKFAQLHDRAQYGTRPDEQLFSVALELCITWVNRILFLKLLESQLVKYHAGNREYAFLNREIIPDFDELNKLFFRVLARKPADRQESIQRKFSRIPYLNSSLFELTELENNTISINQLDNGLTLPMLRNSVLNDNPAYGSGGPQNSKPLHTLSYLFAFLDAYDFASESAGAAFGEMIQEKNRTLINASVLGLIFEKINGYKDGSFYTPGFITEYMCRETIRRAVVQKFNDANGWHCADFAALEDIDLDRAGVSRSRANALINEIRICDPAVGSGHFLVSALNELIAVKSDLGLLQDAGGKRIKNYSVSIVNDELVVQDEDETPFQYVLQTTGKPTPERQRIQKTLFHEKQTLIENCLFGVDINANSVKICRLRLWIELLKNAYYTDESGFTELETLPNIDINIKQGNSLLSKFSLTEDLSEVFKRQKFTLQTYRNAVAAYKNAPTKEAKAELQHFINEIKSQFRESVSNRDPKRKKLADLRGQRMMLDNNIDIFGNPMKDPALVAAEIIRTDKSIEQIEAEIAEIQNNSLFRGAFEWRFEFPEVLNDKGEFVGFDVIIGNPPYIRQEELGSSAKAYFRKTFTKTYAGTADLYVFFVEQGFNILRPNGEFVYIIPNKWMRAGYGLGLRKFFQKERLIEIDDFGDLQVFDDATTYPCIIQARKAAPLATFHAVNLQTLTYDAGLTHHAANVRFEIPLSAMPDEGWTLANAEQQTLQNKLAINVVPLGEYIEHKAYYGIKTGLTEAFVIDEATKNRLIDEDAGSAKVIRPFILGRDVKTYGIPQASKFLILFQKGISNQKRQNIEAEEWLELTYPAIYVFLSAYKEKAKARTDKGDYWWELRACDYYAEFAKPKIMYQKFQVKPAFIFDEQGLYCNDSMWIITKADKALFTFLNSKMGWYLISNYCTAIQNGYQLIFQYFGQIPIPVRLAGLQAVLTTKADQILTAKSLDPTADTAALEAEIDRLVYGLYGLTDEEIAIVEGGSPAGGKT